MNLTIFKSEQFGEIRTVLIDNEPWFVAKDVCGVLDIANSRDAVSTLDDDEKADVVITDTSSNGISQDRTFKAVNEYGLYALIFKSRKPEAKDFKRWITHSVLPSLRKYDGYITGQEQMTKEQFMAKAIIFANEVIEDMKKELSDTKEKNRELTCAYEYQKSQNKLLTHINKTYCATEIAKELGMKSANELNLWLKDKGVQYYMNKTWVPYSKYATSGYFDIKQEVLDSGKVIYHRKITQTGREFILTLFDKEEQ